MVRHSVTPKRWKDIWLNEGFATYAQWLWNRHRGTTTFAVEVARLRAVPASDPLWRGKVGDPKPTTLYDELVYDRGALTLVMLQERIGMPAMERLLRRWAAAHRHGNASTKQFIALAEQVSGEDLDGFFRTWLFSEGKPAF